MPRDGSIPSNNGPVDDDIQLSLYSEQSVQDALQGLLLSDELMQLMGFTDYFDEYATDTEQSSGLTTDIIRTGCIGSSVLPRNVVVNVRIEIEEGEVEDGEEVEVVGEVPGTSHMHVLDDIVHGMLKRKRHELGDIDCEEEAEPLLSIGSTDIMLNSLSSEKIEPTMSSVSSEELTVNHASAVSLSAVHALAHPPSILGFSSNQIIALGDGPLQICALDCEMCSTAAGLELTRISVVCPLRGVVLNKLVG